MVNAGRILILAQGEWDNLTNYVPLDLVSKGETAYLARKASVGIDPETDVEMFYWQPFGSVAKIATTEIPGLVMPDGTTLTIDSTGLLKAEIGVSELTDVLITNLANGSFLRYDAAAQKWKNVTLGTASSKNSTNAVTQGSSDLVESGAVYTKYDELRTDGAKAYKTDDATETSLESNDLIPFYDTSATAKKKMTVANMVNQIVSNPNLLDNPWFTVNQRGASSYSGASIAKQYTFDRWLMSWPSSDVSVTKNADGTITYTNNSSSDNIQLIQLIDNLERLSNRQVTLSIDVVAVTGNVQVALSLNLAPWTGYVNQYVSQAGMHSKSGSCGDFSSYTDGDVKVLIGLDSGESITIRAIKLELGSVSTLAMDTAPNYQQELAKCQRYFVRFSAKDYHGSYAALAMGWVDATTRTNAMMLLSTPVPMRTRPIISYSGTLKIEPGDIGISSIVSDGTDSIVSSALIVTMQTAQTANQTISLWIRNDASAFLDLSADL